jgi:hypothetical protein
MSGNLEEISRYAEKSNQALARLRAAKTADDQRNAWEDFLGHFARCIGRQISFGMKDEKTRPWANRLRNSSTRDDAGLTFLRAARNVVDHGLEPVAVFNERSISIGPGFVHLEGGGSIVVENCFFNGVPTGNFSLVSDMGRVVSLVGEPTIPIHEVPANIRLVPVKTEKRLMVDVPANLMGIEIMRGSPIELAQAGIEFLKKSYEELLKTKGADGV